MKVLQPLFCTKKGRFWKCSLFTPPGPHLPAYLSSSQRFSWTQQSSLWSPWRCSKLDEKNLGPDALHFPPCKSPCSWFAQPDSLLCGSGRLHLLVHTQAQPQNGGWGFDLTCANRETGNSGWWWYFFTGVVGWTKITTGKKLHLLLENWFGIHNNQRWMRMGWRLSW